MELIKLEEFELLAKEEQKELLQELKEEVGTTALIKHWGISRTKMYNMIHQLDVPVQSRKGKNPTCSMISLCANPTKCTIIIAEETQGKIIAGRLLKLAKLLEEDESLYKIKLDLREE